MNSLATLLVCCCTLLAASRAAAETTLPERIDLSTTWTLSNSPYIAPNDVTIPPRVSVSIEPGVEVRFAAQKRLQVFGTLLARGTETQRIKFTKASPARDTNYVVPKSLRLVHGFTHEVRDGQLQVLYNGRWRQVCSRNRDWSRTDCRLACRELGFADGNFTLMSIAENYTASIVYQSPQCTGNETSLLHCPGARSIDMGWDVCHIQELVGLYCWGANMDLYREHWSGIEIYNASRRLQVLHTPNTIMNISNSEFNFVDIMFAGVNMSQHNAAALSASPYPPFLSNVRFMHNAYDALNYSRVKGPVEFLDAEFANNRGHGFHIRTAVGNVNLTRVNSHGNGGDGGVIRMIDYHWQEIEEEITQSDTLRLCHDDPSPMSPRFPFLIEAKVRVPTALPYDTCTKVIYAGYEGQLLTISMLEAELDPEAYALIRIKDVMSGVQVGFWNVTMRNDTIKPRARLYQGVVSQRQQLQIEMTWVKNTRLTRCSTLEPCVRVVLQASVSEGRKTPEVTLTDSNFTQNYQRGLTIDNPWTYVVVKRSNFSNNLFDAGMKVVNGSADIFLNHTSFHSNERTGLNISTAGGLRIVNASTFSQQLGFGMDVWHQYEDQTRYPPHGYPLTTEVFHTEFKENTMAGARFYNACVTHNIVVNNSQFLANHRQGVLAVSCLHNPLNVTNFTVAFSHFANNERNAIEVAPMLNMIGGISNNTFEQHKQAVVYIDNGINFIEQRLYKSMRVNYLISYNIFQRNSGNFVLHARLLLNSVVQFMQIMFNKFENNTITKAPGYLNPRSSVHAVVLVNSDSGQMVFNRNFLRNPNSEFEVGTHLAAPNRRINATLNFWGTPADFGATTWDQVSKSVFARLFDKIERYTLAEIDYWPALREHLLHTSKTTIETAAYSHKFREPGSNIIGGPIIEDFTNVIVLEPGQYRVTRDISVPLRKTLKISAGSTLMFENSVGIFVEGSLLIEGTAATIVNFTMQPSPSFNRTELQVRLADGKSLHEGRVEINIDGEWGTICERDFELIDASVVCNMLGYSIHPYDWIIPREQRNPASNSVPILRSGLHCRPWDLDIRSCPADGKTDHSCTHSADAHVRCKPKAWAGVRITTTNDISTIRYLNIEKGGLLDYFRMQYSPGLQVDYHKHTIDQLTVQHCLSDGFVMLHSELYRQSRITNCRIEGNLGHGIQTHSPLLLVDRCIVNNNSLSGFDYYPGFSEEQAYSFRTALPATKKSLNSASGVVSSVKLESSNTDFLVMVQSSVSVNTTYRIQLDSGQPQERIIVTLAGFNTDYNWERLTFYDSTSSGVSAGTPKWRVPEDLVMFPIISTGSSLTLELRVNGPLSDSLALIVQSRDMRGSIESNSRDYYPPTELVIRDSSFTNNAKGLSFTHFNDGADNDGAEIYIRRRFELMDLSRLTVTGNSQYGLHIPSVSPFQDDLFAPSYAEVIEGSSRTARISYTISSCNVTDNGAAVFSDHNHVVFANNVWNYSITDSDFSYSRNGGFVIDFPFVSKKFDWRYEPDVDHIFHFQRNRIIGNRNAEFIVRGYHSTVTISNNVFTDNNCRLGLLGLKGMEKRVSIERNQFTGNTNCQSIIEFDIISQTETSDVIPGSVMYNTVTGNACPNTTDLNSIAESSTPSCSAVSVVGIQNITVQRNIIYNGYKFELIAGVHSSDINDRFDCTENYWKSTNVEEIRMKIFDFENWNNFAVADFSKFLLTESLTSSVSSAIIPSAVIDISRPFGGRIVTSMRLPWRRTPYEVSKDLTIMPGATLTIDAGVVVHFYPSVGILVLGRIELLGSFMRPVRLLPMPAMSAPSTPGRKRRQVTSLAASSADYFARYSDSEAGDSVKVTLERNGIRLIAGKVKNEGFLEFYNATVSRWDIACDNQFSEEVGRVICRELGVETYNAIVRQSHLYDHYVYGFDNFFIRKYYWMRTYNCKGTEAERSQCAVRMNYDALRCGQRRGYIFLRCGDSNLNLGQRYWGNIRVAHPAKEQSSPIVAKPSIFRHVLIYGAGVLHSQKVPAIQTTFQYPTFDHVSIMNCASDGYKIVAPRQFVRVANSTVKDNYGTAYSIIILNGDSADPAVTPLSSFHPLTESNIPYNLFGLVDICDKQKELLVTDRVLVYYKYSYETRACTKMFRSMVSAKRVAIRFLQIQLYYDPFTKNSIELFNGPRFNITELIADITAVNLTSEDDRRRTFMTGSMYDVMGIHVHASSAAPTNGFIAEIVTLPLSPDKAYPDLNKHMEHYVRQCQFTNNQDGAVSYSGVGEINPDFVVHFNQFTNNGLGILNITSRPVIAVQMQSGRNLDVSNNLVHKNFGGVEFNLWSSGLSKSAKSNISNNVIAGNSHGGALWMSGNHYNQLRVTDNFIDSNVAEMRDLIQIRGVLMKPFSRNYINNNIAGYIMNATGDESLSTMSEFHWNGFYNNRAINWTRRSTVFLGSSKHQFRNNFFRNLENDFEIAGGNMSWIRTADMDANGKCIAFDYECPVPWVKRLEYNKCICYRRDKVDLRYNWWGESSRFYVPGRIWEFADDEFVIPMDYTQHYTDNTSVLQDRHCPPTWNSSASNCYWFFGAPFDYEMAKGFCQNEVGGVLGDSRDTVNFLTALMTLAQNNYDWINRYAWTTRGWVYSEQPFPSSCPVVRNGWLEGFPCDTPTSFFCQVSPSGTLRGLETIVLASILSVFAIFLLLACILLAMWMAKSRQRQKARLVRRDNYRASMKSSRSMQSAATQNDYLSGSGSRPTTVNDFYTLTSGAGNAALAASAGDISDSSRSAKESSYLTQRRELDRGIRLADSVETLDKARVEELQSASSAPSSDNSSSIYRPSLHAAQPQMHRFVIENQIPETEASETAHAPSRIRMGTGGSGAGNGDQMRRNKLTLSRPTTNPLHAPHPQARPPTSDASASNSRQPTLSRRGDFDSEFDSDDDEGVTSSDELAPSNDRLNQRNGFGESHI